MKSVAVLMLSVFMNISPRWLTDFQQAEVVAQKEHKLILLSFSGSDWCGPCIRLHKEIFDSPSFSDFAKDRLVLLNADFPRLKKNQLPKALQAQNDQLADQYNRSGHFPFTVLLTSDAKAIKSWDGYPSQGAASFIQDIKQAADDH